LSAAGAALGFYLLKELRHGQRVIAGIIEDLRPHQVRLLLASGENFNSTEFAASCCAENRLKPCRSLVRSGAITSAGMRVIQIDLIDGTDYAKDMPKRTL